MQKPYIIMLDGPMGAGKTTVARSLHLKLSRVALLSWDELKWLVNDLQNTLEDKNLITEMRFEMVKKMLANGISVIVEGGFNKKERRDLYLELAQQEKLHLFGYYFVASEEILLERAMSRPKPNTEKEKISQENILKNIKNHPEREYGFEIIDTTLTKTNEIVEKIISSIDKLSF